MGSRVSTLGASARLRSGAGRAPPHRTHLAIIGSAYLVLILAGLKTVESRLSLTRREPFGRVRPGDTILFRVRGGGYAARARVARVESFEGLDRDGVRALAERYEPLVRGGRAYWAGKRHARYATLMWLERPRPETRGPEWTPHGRAWLTLGPPPPPPRDLRRPAHARAR